MLERMRRMLQAEPVSAPTDSMTTPSLPPADPGLLDPPSPPRNREPFCGACGRPMQVSEEIDVAGYSRATGQRWIEYHNVWTCPRWVNLSENIEGMWRMHDRFPFGPKRRRPA